MINFVEEKQIPFEVISPELQNQVHRELTGEAGNDLLKREDVYDAIRNLRTQPSVPSAEFQRGLSAAMKAISDLSGERDKPVCTCMTDLDADAYELGGPLSRTQKPPRCIIHPNQDGKMKSHG